MLAARSEGRQDGTDVVFQEQHRRDDDVACADVAATHRRAPRVRAPFVGGVHHEIEAGQLAAAAMTRARATAPDRWLSIVTMTTRIGVGSAAEMRFGIVQGLDGDRSLRHAHRRNRSVLRRALPRTKNGILRSSLSASTPTQPPALPPRAQSPQQVPVRPHRATRRASSPRCDGAASSWNSKSLAEHATAGAPRDPSSADGPRCRRSRWRPRTPSAASSAPGKSCTCTGAEMTAQGMPRRLAMWRSIWVPSTSSGCSSAMLASTSR